MALVEFGTKSCHHAMKVEAPSARGAAVPFRTSLVASREACRSGSEVDEVGRSEVRLRSPISRRVRSWSARWCGAPVFGAVGPGLGEMKLVTSGWLVKARSCDQASCLLSARGSKRWAEGDREVERKVIGSLGPRVEEIGIAAVVGEGVEGSRVEP